MGLFDRFKKEETALPALENVSDEDIVAIADGELIDATNHPMMAFSFPCEKEIPKGAFLRKQRDEDA